MWEKAELSEGSLDSEDELAVRNTEITITDDELAELFGTITKDGRKSFASDRKVDNRSYALWWHGYKNLKSFRKLPSSSSEASNEESSNLAKIITDDQSEGLRSGSDKYSKSGSESRSDSASSSDFS